MLSTTARLPHRLWLVAAILALITTTASAAEKQWITFEGKDGPGKGKKIVLISGDEEYRSEEGLPQLAKILAEHHGFTCTVLFSIDPASGKINPDETHNIPGLQALDDADLMIIQTRFRDLPDDQMKHVADYISSGKPVIGMRTATHSFAIPAGHTYSKYNWNNGGPEWKGGFGREILGETWVNHWGSHGSQSTRGVIAPGQQDNPIVRGCKDIWAPTDVYEAHPDTSCTAIILGEVLQGMHPTDPPLSGAKNQPMMPIAWTRMYKAGDNKEGRAFTTTMGAAIDLLNEDLRRLLVNASYWCIGMEDKIPQKADVDLVGEFHPTMFGFGKYVKDKVPSDYAGE